jgi:hypothetical protein
MSVSDVAFALRVGSGQADQQRLEITGAYINGNQVSALVTKPTQRTAAPDRAAPDRATLAPQSVAELAHRANDFSACH